MNINFVIFGGTGDLTKRKLAPALDAISQKQKLTINLVGVGRSDYTDSTYRKYLGLQESNQKLQVKYYRGDVVDKASMQGLSNIIRTNKADQNIFYLATSYTLFDKIFSLLQEYRHLPIKIMIEKPFGSDYTSWKKLNSAMRKDFIRDQVFRVDHYVAKQTVDNILLLRFSNPLFENIWNGSFIDTIKIVAKEERDVNKRLDYYDGAGAIRDMIQNHLLQTAAFILMEPPHSLDPDEIRKEKTKAISKLAYKDIEVGQYADYQKEVKKRLNKKTQTETYAKLMLLSKSKRWKGTNIILETGKKLETTEAYIELQFRKEPCMIYCNINTTPNVLRIDIQPEKSISLTINTRMSGEKPHIEPVQMNVSPKDDCGENTPESYEIIISECIKGNKRIFIRATELDASWKLIDTVKNKVRGKELFIY